TITCTQKVTVNDAENPVVVCPPNVVVSTGSGLCTAVVNDTALGTAIATDNCPGVTVTRSGVPAGNIFAKGTTTLTYTATDANGNTTTCTQVVIVSDNEKPNITCPANVIVNTATGQCSAVVSDVTLGTAAATDNCLGVTITRSGVPAGN